MKKIWRKLFLPACFSLTVTTGCANSEEQTELSYVKTGNLDSDYRIIFIHGSPGNKEAYDAYLEHPELNRRVEMVSVDRLGYGVNQETVETSLLNQARSILPFLSEDKSNILVGHSLGSPIALQLALLAPEKVAGMVLIASAFDPELEHPKWYNQVADTVVAKWILPTDMNNSNEEMMVLSKELSLIAGQDWSVLKIPIDIVHGNEDELADFGNAVFAYEKLSPNGATLSVLKGEGHLVLWQNTELVTDEILQMLSQLEQR